jgi:hypothetical protein
MVTETEDLRPTLQEVERYLKDIIYSKVNIILAR